MDDQGRHCHFLQFALEIERRGATHLHTTKSESCALRIVLTELIDKLLKAARILHLKLFASWSRPIDRRELLGALILPTLGNDFDLFPELGRLVRLRAHPGCADNY